MAWLPLSRPSRRRRIPEGIRITKVGLWYVLFAVLVAIAATNTGNNALYLVVAVMLAALVVSGVTSRANVDGLAVDLRFDEDVHANQPFSIEFELRNRSRWLPRWFLLVSASRHGVPRLIPYLPRRGTSRGRLDLLLRRRGRRRIPSVHVSSLFPFGFFRKGVRYQVDREITVFPELYGTSATDEDPTARHGELPVRRAGWGHGLHTLRGFRHGDDPRGIHWKQTARTGEVIYMVRESDESRRLSVLFDNGVGPLESDEARERFERLVSETATAAVDYLDRGFEVELVTRDRALPFGLGWRQRLAVLEHLALIEPAERSGDELRSRDPGAPQVRIQARDQDDAGRTDPVSIPRDLGAVVEPLAGRPRVVRGPT